jgi:hypothetical protein
MRDLPKLTRNTKNKKLLGNKVTLLCLEKKKKMLESIKEFMKRYGAHING